MLVLSRKKNEKILVRYQGDTIIEITCLEIRGDKVRLGFSAHESIGFVRDEVWQAQQQHSASTSSSAAAGPTAASVAGAPS